MSDSLGWAVEGTEKALCRWDFNLGEKSVDG